MNTLSFFNPRFTSDLFDVIDRNFTQGETTERGIAPKVDVRETQDLYVLDMELPGRTEKDVEINLKERVLSITSVHSEENKKEQEGEWLIRERKTSRFARSFTLPEDIDAEKVSAAFSNGLLTITIPRKPEGKARTIAIGA